MNRPFSGRGFPAHILGVLGGMGPLATVDFLRKLVTMTEATRDQDHLPMLVRFCPEIPDRADALAGRGESPLPGLVAAARALEAGGAQFLAMPCNTAHAWYEQISRAVSVPLLHIADATLAETAVLSGAAAVGLLATTGTLRAGIYQSRSASAIDWVTLDEEAQERLVMCGIRAVKARRLGEAVRLLSAAAEALIDRGATSIVMGCTEVPVALADLVLSIPLVDPTLALAKACLAWAADAPGSRVAEDKRGAQRSATNG
jgi:aspartate racemase